MKTQIIILAILFASATASTRKAALTATTDCSCSELTQQADCTSLGCAWVTINGSSSCSAATVTSTTSCSSTDQATCDSHSGCAWTNAGACATFTKCEDYTITTAANSAQCYLKDKTCIPGTASGTSVPCATGTVTCTNVTDQAVCSSGLMPSSTSMCWWSTSCISQDLSKCSTITDSQLCKNMGCVYGTACAAPTCASVTAQTQCTYVNADTTGQVQICSWANNACVDAADTSALTAATCFSNTSKMYKWNGTSCVACSGSSSNAFLLAFFALLAMLMF